MKNLTNQWLELKSLEKMLQQEMQVALTNGTHALTLNEFYVLHCLKETQGHKLQISALSEKIGLSISATSRMLTRFEESCGVITRCVCKSDRRGVQISLTPLGKEELAEAYRLVEPVLAKYQAQLSNFSNRNEAK